MIRYMVQIIAMLAGDIVIRIPYSELKISLDIFTGSPFSPFYPRKSRTEMYKNFLSLFYGEIVNCKLFLCLIGTSTLSFEIVMHI